MTIIVKNKVTLVFDEFKFQCCIGKNGLVKHKIEGDKKTPVGIFSLGNLYYRKDRHSAPLTKLKCIPIKTNMGWCDDQKNKKYYNKLIKVNKNIKYEKLFRKDSKYDFMIPIKYNTNNITLGKGSAIFIHCSRDLKSTSGCVALKKKDLLILLKLINKKTKIKIA